MQGSKGDTDIKNRLVATVGQGEGGRIWENSSEACTFPYAKQTASGSSVYDVGTQSWCSVATWRMGWAGSGGEVQEGVDTWMPVADSC